MRVRNYFVRGCDRAARMRLAVHLPSESPRILFCVYVGIGGLIIFRREELNVTALQGNGQLSVIRII